MKKVATTNESKKLTLVQNGHVDLLKIVTKLLFMSFWHFSATEFSAAESARELCPTVTEDIHRSVLNGL